MLLAVVAAAAPAAPAAGATPGASAAFDLREIGRIAEPALRPADAPDGPPTWSDEFDGDALDPARWSYRASGPRHDGVLTPDAVAVGGGTLTIATYTEEGTHYSGMIGTQRTASAGFEQTYGYFEARARFSTTPGQWSAFWLQSPSIGDLVDDPEVAGVELDVVEHRARCVTAPPENPPDTCSPESDVSDRIQQAIVWGGYGSSSKAAVKLSAPLPGLGNGSWHTYAVRWSPDALEFSYDDTETWSVAGPISRRSQFIVLGSEVWHAFAGEIPPGGYGSLESSTTTMQVDYVRAWAATPAAPVSRTAPVVSGSLRVGSSLTCSTGSWAGVPPPSYERAWLRDGAEISGATASQYAIGSDDRGHSLGCRVTATNTEGSSTALSAGRAVAPAPAPPPPPPPPPRPTAAVVVVDRGAPIARLSGRRRQRVGRTAFVTITCVDEPCLATVAGAVRVPRVGRSRARTFRPASVSRTIGAGGRSTVKLKLSASARVAITRALRARRRVVLAIGVRVADRAGNARVLTRDIVFARPSK